jgi:ribulose kinase
MASRRAIAPGLDFGAESVRAFFVDVPGRERAAAVACYRTLAEVLSGEKPR